MAVLEILKAPNEKLKIPATPVTDISSVQQLIDDMLDTMYATDDGIGLASTQVGRKEAIIVIDISEERDAPLILINPEVVDGENVEKGQEGCLSVPGYYADVERFTQVKVSGLDREGNVVNIENDDFLAIVLQHEIDHLKGKLFIDYLSPLKQKMALKKVKKAVSQSA
ncbi:peptide deformylase [Pseudoalteromonas sp. MMG013]|uniref:Peptide deformylase n=1 Tax=Pseudoalteromonas aurantia 208 TaxID=1314867 RepID=A0ABR9EF37_9GAMM|nr:MULTISPECIES: peptide deformylase [Pseudoalteromonas]MBE0368373.1 peptide deformylase [Pseudoalteromonas aurantia 208]MBQ4849859.1 peptide deformylase [Pseudoalteromonas sp. MMG012]MBQ4864204.1 peptide deformylase [Pseudoalteromonas sp. MMG013]